MISEQELGLAGKTLKTHGIGGEISMAFFSPEIAEAVEKGTCLLMKMQGIFTPFFAESVRPKGSEARLVKLCGIDSQEEAAKMIGKDLYMLASALPNVEEEEMEDGLYAGQLIGYKAIDGHSGRLLGEIIDIDDQTENVLFIIKRTGGGHDLLIPVADELISELSTDEKTITFNLPEGLLNIDSI